MFNTSLENNEISSQTKKKGRCQQTWSIKKHATVGLSILSIDKMVVKFDGGN